ncbi:FAD-dependent 5-carboxymethylaminomethyl-2-thiouridine(34) oxidoreductase MnmC [Paucibacter soli]|uniref:FAD-dependent 5-carboxymethylaminomethyl-2-thiouridine(34) oxidoreductase MnmC n=1 Tax=Paucibacter soli TaxID=3133433 RepID=UPI0030A5B30E
MKSCPIVPARVDFSGDPSTPRAPQFGDVYHARAGAFAQAEHVFLRGNGLPERWRGRRRFVILETGFGLGNNFLASWAAWRVDPQRAERLVFISIEKHPLTRADMARAHAGSPAPELAAQLLQAWPPLTHNLHRLDFENGRVELLLALGEARDWLAELVAEVDAFYLDGFAPALNPEIWDPYLLKRLGRLAAPEATAATWSAARPVRDGLAAAGFEVRRRPGLGSKWHMTVARYQPRHAAQRPAARLPLAREARQVLVLGAGLAGAACSAALREQGLQVTVLEARDAPAQGASGNPGGLFHGTLNPDDGTHARFNRAAALQAERAITALAGQLPWLQRGLLRLETRRSLAEMQAQIERLALPDDYVQALPVSDAAARSGLALTQPAWYYPGGGAAPPAALVRAWLADTPVRYGVQVAALRRTAAGWLALDAQGHCLAEAEAVVLALGHASAPLLCSLAAQQPWPLTPQRGQLSMLPALPGLRVPLLPVAGSGYAIGDGQGGLWCGATAQDGDEDGRLRPADHAHNLQQYEQLSGLPLPAAAWQLPPQGRVGWRLTTPDRLPLVGGLADPAYQGRRDQLRLLPRLPGLLVCTGLGSRGIAWAPLCARIVAAQLAGAPLPLQADLVDALDPARFARSRRPQTDA